MFDVRTVVRAVVVIVAGSFVVAGLGIAGATVPGSSTVDVPEGLHAQEPIEESVEEPVPDPDDPYFEAEASDGSWISYVNPRDEYRSPYLGGGSAKVCVTLVNEDGDPVVGHTVPNTTVTVPTGDSLEWHPDADPFTVEYPLPDHYERPLDADQFGTNPDLPQGDGYLDSHCLEFHGLPEDGTVEYGEVEVDGEYAEWLDVVGYIQQEHEAWESDVDPVGDAVSYEEAGGGWTYRTEASHGQAVVVLRLDPPADAYEDTGGDDGTSENESDDGNGPEDVIEGSDGGSSDDDGDGDGDDGIPGFGVLAPLTVLTALAVSLSRR